MAVAERDYVLGTHDDEIARLRLQHAVWRPRALDAWRRAGFNAGQTLIDIGCGPGCASADLAEIGERVSALDRSRRFLDALEAQGNPRIEPHEIDLDEDPLPVHNAHGAWARWVFAFVKRPRDLVSRVGSALKPGGVVVIHEYLDYETWSFLQSSPEHEEFVRTVMRSWRASGGEPNIGRELPGWLEQAGFEIRSLQPIVDVIRPADFSWQWGHAFIRTGLARLVELGELSPERGETIARAIAARDDDPQAMMVNPTVLEIIAVRR